MISNDAIEAKLDHLRDAVEDVRATTATLSEKVDDVNKSLGEKIDKQGEQIKALDKGLDRVNTTVKVVLTIIGLTVSAAVILNTLRNFHWI